MQTHFKRLSSNGIAHIIVPMVVVVAVAAVGSFMLVNSHAASAVGFIKGDGDLCLDVSGGKLAKDVELTLNTCTGSAVTQQWSLPGDGTIRDGDYCLVDKGGSKSPETHARIETCGTTTYEDWQVASNGEIISKNASLCLEDRNGLVKTGNPVWLNTCNGTTAQLWSVPKGGSVTTPNPPSPTPSPAPTPSSSLPKPSTILNFADWELQEPIASGSSILTIPTAKLLDGYSDAYMYSSSTASGNAVTFFTPENGAHTANSSYPRSELRELMPNGSDANWNMSGTNIMDATLEATDITNHTVIGQVHIGSPLPGSSVAASTKPLLELYYYSNGSLVAGLEKSPTGSQTTTTIGTVPLGTKFTYAIQVSGDKVTIKLNNNAPVVLTAATSFNSYGMYFKAGDYLQTTGTSTTVGAHVEFYALSIQH
jgi:hypothetical protein